MLAEDVGCWFSMLARLLMEVGWFVPSVCDASNQGGVVVLYILTLADGRW